MYTWPIYMTVNRFRVNNTRIIEVSRHVCQLDRLVSICFTATGQGNDLWSVELAEGRDKVRVKRVITDNQS